MRYVITGGAGFIGSHLCRTLVEQGHEVVAVDNLVTGAKQNVADLIDRPEFRFVHHDVSEPFSVDGPVDRVLHFASPASPADFEKLSIEILHVGSRGTEHALQLARDKGARFFLASTSEVYGDPEVHPQPETYLGNVNCTGIRGAYDESKRFAEAMTFAYHRRHGVDIRIVRIFNTYGPFMRLDDGRAITNFLAQAFSGRPITVYGDGSQTRSFCYIADEVRGLLGLLESDYVGPMNIGSEFEIPIRELAEICVRVTGSSSEIHYEPLPADDPQQRRPDLTLARRVLGWEPTVAPEEGIARTAEYFRGLLDQP
jgi:dTDP-glucose 4,6-dehydratase